MTKYLKHPKHEEKKFQLAFVNDADSVLKGAKYITHEAILHKADNIFRQSTRYEFDSPEELFGEKEKMGLGRIDLVFRYKRDTYCAEIKYRKCENNDFWDALKIIGYTEYYKWQTDNKDYLPAIIMPKESIKLEHQIVAGRCDIRIFLIYKDGDNYKLKMLDDRPYWKQGETVEASPPDDF